MLAYGRSIITQCVEMLVLEKDCSTPELFNIRFIPSTLQYISDDFEVHKLSHTQTVSLYLQQFLYITDYTNINQYT